MRSQVFENARFLYYINERRSAVLVIHGKKAHSRYYPPVKPAEGGTEVCTHFDYRPAILLPRQGVGLVVNLPESVFSGTVIFQLHHIDVLVGLQKQVYAAVAGLVLGFNV